jgi:hypothetical protein
MERPTPSDAFNYQFASATPIPKTMPVWQVQTKDFLTDKGYRIGMVARPWGFEDSPDAEVISGGTSSKGLDAVAIGRHGNFFGWGFAASPDYMTDEAKVVFANAVAYISRFNGQGLIARKYDQRATKEDVKLAKYQGTRQGYDAEIKMTRDFNTRMAEEKKSAEAKQGRGEELSPMERMSLTFKPMSEKSFEEYLKGNQRDLFEKFGMDSTAYRRYYDENYDYFYAAPGSYKLAVDDDVKSLRIPNTDSRVLAKAIELLEKGTDSAKGRRILTRYTLLRYQTPKEWRTWFDANRSRLFFTQAGGFVFMVNTRDRSVPGNNYSTPVGSSVPEPGETDALNPVSIAAGVAPGEGGAKEVVVKFRIEEGFHIYAVTPPPNVPTTVSFGLPAGYSTVGVVKTPAPEPYGESRVTIFTKLAAFSQAIAGSGKGTAKVFIKYQACDDHMCLPPATLELQVRL